MNRRQFIALSPLGSAAALLAACSSTAPPAASAPTTVATSAPTAVPASGLADNLTMATSTIVANLDPQYSGGQSAGIFNRLAFDTLTIPDKDGKIVPWLATSWKTIDPTTWEFTLRDDVAFQDGMKFDASVVKANLDRMLGPGGVASATGMYFLGLTGADVVSPATVRIRTKQPDPILPNRMSILYMAHPDYPNKVGDPPANAKTNGTGPFQSSNLTVNQSYEVVFNPTSWRAQQTNITLRNIKIIGMADPAAMMAALRASEVDMAFGPPFDQANSLKSAGLNLQSALAASVFELRMHITGEAETSPMRKKQVRQALNYAVDKDAVRNAAYGGFGKAADGQLLGSGTFGYDPSLKPYPYNPDMAKQLLAQAGVPDGFSTKIGLVTTGPGKQISEPIQGMFAAIGVQADLDQMDLASLVSKVNAGTLDPMNVLGADAFPLFDADPVLRMYSDVVPEINRLWGNQQFDDLYNQSSRELDSAKRLSLIHQALGVMRDDPPTVFLFQQEWVYALGRKISGFAPRADAVVMFDAMQLAKV
jgi:peptide/nickel transport system substrate-binding protein